ncbi:glycosyltransferase family 4 protein [Fibrobacterota bacterium]
MRILFISNQLLFEETRFGGAKRLFNFARALNEQCELHVICLDTAQELSPFHKRKYKFPSMIHFPFKRPSLLHRLQYNDSCTVKKHIPEIEKFLGKKKFDAILLGYQNSLAFLHIDAIAGNTNVVYLEDDLILAYNREKIIQAKSLFLRLFWRVRYRQILRYYKNKFKRINKVICISNEEKKIMSANFPNLETQVVKYGIDLREFPYLEPNHQKVIGYIGNFNHPPNQDAMAFFLDDIFPYMKQRIKGISLRIAGTGLPARLQEKHEGDSAIIWTENVATIELFYRGIGVFINPIISGKGLRTKIIEAAAFGRPVVSSPLGAEGLDELSLEIADSRDKYVEGCLRLFTNREHYRSVSAHNRSIIEEKFSIDTLSQQLLDILKD